LTNNYLFMLYNKNNDIKMKIFFLCFILIFFLTMMISNPVFSVENTKDLRYADFKRWI